MSTSRAVSKRATSESTVPDVPDGTPLWVMPVYLTGLIAILVGERALTSWPVARFVASGAGALAVIIATAARFVPTWRAGGQRAVVERWLGVVSVAGLVALLLYGATTPWATQHIHLLPNEPGDHEHIQDLLTVIWTSLLTVSVIPMVFAELALYPMRDAAIVESRRVKSAMSAGFTLAVALVYGALLVYAAGGPGWKADFSYFRTARPSEATRNIARKLKEPMQVVGFFPQVNEVRTEVLGYLHDLSHAAPRIHVQMHDRLLEPKLARRLHASEDGIIVLSRGNVRKTLRIGTTMEASRPALRDLDRRFQEKLLKLARDQRKAYLTIGHGELNDQRPGRKHTTRTATIMKLLLQKQNYEVRNLGLSNGLGSSIPKDADVVLVLGPQEPFAPEEIDALRRFTQRGGKLLLALDPDALPDSALANLPSGQTSDASAVGSVADASSPRTGGPATRLAFLNDLAGTVGLTFVPSPLANDNRHLRRHFNASDNKFLMTNNFSSHASVSTLSRNASRAAIVFDGAGYLKRRPGTKATVDFAVRSDPGTFADKNLNNKFDPPNETRKVYFVGAAITHLGTSNKSTEGKKLPKDQRAFVFADADVFSDTLLGKSLSNQVLLVDAVRWLVGEESFAGQISSEKDVHINRTRRGDQVWFYATIFGAPMLVLLLGLWLRRRSLRSQGESS